MKRPYLSLLVAVGIAMAGNAIQAQDKYPSKPVKILVPYGPGGATDIVARIVGERLRDMLGQNFYVENKPGGYGMIAIEDMARSRPDGYTLMVGNVSTNAITPVLFKSKLKIDYDRATADSNPARISDAEISWKDASDGGNYTLDRKSGELTVIVASSTGGYFLHHRCKDN